MKTLIAAAVMLIGWSWCVPRAPKVGTQKAGSSSASAPSTVASNHDTIEVGKYEGKFTKLTMYVEKSDLELLDFEVTFGNKERFHPRCTTSSRRAAHARDRSPGDERVIKNINLKYKNVGGGGNAKVEIWGWKAEAVARGPEAVQLGQQRLGDARRAHGQRSRKEDHDRIEVGKHEGKWSKLTVRRPR